MRVIHNHEAARQASSGSLLILRNLARGRPQNERIHYTLGWSEGALLMTSRTVTTKHRAATGPSIARAGSRNRASERRHPRGSVPPSRPRRWRGRPTSAWSRRRVAPRSRQDESEPPGQRLLIWSAQPARRGRVLILHPGISRRNGPEAAGTGPKHTLSVARRRRPRTTSRSPAPQPALGRGGSRRCSRRSPRSRLRPAERERPAANRGQRGRRPIISAALRALLRTVHPSRRTPGRRLARSSR